jgi:hypothetical protein
MRFWLLKDVNINFAVLSDVTPCSLVNFDHHMGLGGGRGRNVLSLSTILHDVECQRP